MQGREPQIPPDWPNHNLRPRFRQAGPGRRAILILESVRKQISEFIDVSRSQKWKKRRIWREPWDSSGAGAKSSFCFQRDVSGRTLTAENGFDFPGDNDDCVGYQLTLCQNNLIGRAVDPLDKAHQPQKFPLVDRAECDATELFFSVGKNYPVAAPKSSSRCEPR
jgi:hypothetical protein